jgi:hypothetical protein
MAKKLMLICCVSMCAGLALVGCSPTKPNAAPNALTLSNTSVREDAVVNTPVGVLAAHDPDAGNVFTYALVPGTGATDNASFVIRKDSLLSGAAFDYSVKKTCSIRVETRDQSGASFDTVFTIAVLHINHAPTGASLINVSAADSDQAGSLVGTLAAIDKDAGDSHAFSLVAGAGSEDNASFTIRGDSLFLAATVDASVKNTRSICVQVKDDSSATCQGNVTVTIAHFNHAPTAVLLSGHTVADTCAIGTVVGRLSASDRDSVDTHTFSLVTGTGSGDNGSFLVRNDSLLANAALSAKKTYAILVQAQDDSGATVDSAFTITVKHIDNPPTDILLSDSVIDESAAVGTSVGTLHAIDKDSLSETYKYTLVGGDTGTFEIVYGAVNTKQTLSYSTDSSYSVTVQVSDGNGGVFQKMFTIKVIKAIVINGAAIFSERPTTTGITLASSITVLDQDPNGNKTYFNWTPYDHFEGTKACEFTLNDSLWSNVVFQTYAPDSLTPYANGKLHVALMGSAPDIGIGIASDSTDTNHIYVKATDYGYLPDGKWHEVWIPISVWAPYVDLSAVTLITGFRCPATPGGTYVRGSSYAVDDVYVTVQ